MRVKLTVAYDGTAYCGWQIQPNGITIEEVLNRELSALFKEDIKVSGGSRTDSGVHALGNVAVFDTSSKMPAEKIALAVNQSLPDDIRVVKSEEVASDYHPRYVKCVKTYEYRILNTKINNPMKRLYAYHYHYDLDIEKMNRAAKYLEGEHDFTSFASIHSQVNSFTRTIYECRVTRSEDEVIITVSGNGFLYNMVRIIAGTLIQVGSGLKDPDEIPVILSALDREQAGPTAPPQGLTLISRVEE